MAINEDLVEYLKDTETFSPKPYWDNGQWSYGYGMRAPSSTSTTTKEQAEKDLRARLEKDRSYVANYSAKHSYDWSPAQVDALTSFVYNMGRGGLSELTDGGKRSNEEIVEMLPAYKYGGLEGNKTVQPGLIKRRAKEAAMFQNEALQPSEDRRPQVSAAPAPVTPERRPQVSAAPAPVTPERRPQVSAAPAPVTPERRPQAATTRSEEEDTIEPYDYGRSSTNTEITNEERLSKYASWLMANKDKKGSPDFEKVASAYKILRLGPPQQEGFFSSLAGTAKTLGRLPEALGFASPDESGEAAAREALIAANKSDRPTTSFSDVLAGKGDFTDYLKQTAGSSAGYLAAPAVASLGATLLKAPSPIAKGAGVAALGVQYLTDALTRQAETQQQAIEEGRTPEKTSLGRAAVAATGETALDVAGFKYFKPVFGAFPIVGRLFGEAGEKGAKEAEEAFIDAAKKGKISFGGGIMRGFGKGAAFEIPQEIGQQALERWQAGLSLTDDEARNEFFEAGVGAGILGGGLGGLGGATSVYGQRAKGRQEELIKAAAEEEAAAKKAGEEEATKEEAGDVEAEKKKTAAQELRATNLNKAAAAITAYVGDSPSKTEASVGEFNKLIRDATGLDFNEAEKLVSSLKKNGVLSARDKTGIRTATKVTEAPTFKDLTEVKFDEGIPIGGTAGETDATGQPKAGATDTVTTGAGTEVSVSGPATEGEGTEGTGGQGLADTSVPITDVDGTEGGSAPALTPVQKLENYIETAGKLNLGLKAVKKATGLSEAEVKQALSALEEQGVLVRGKQGFKLAEDIESAGKPVVSKEAPIPEQLQALQSAGYRPTQTGLIARFFKPDDPKSATRARKYLEEGTEAVNLIEQLNTLVRSGSATPYTQGLIKRLSSEVIDTSPPLNEARLHIQQINQQKELVSNLRELKEADIPAADVALDTINKGATKEELAEIRAFVARQYEQLGREKTSASEAESRDKATIRDELERKVAAARQSERAPSSLLSVAERDLRDRGITDEAIDVLGAGETTETPDVVSARGRVKQAIESARGEKRGSIEPAVDKAAVSEQAAEAVDEYNERRIPRKDRGVGLRFQRPSGGKGVAKSIIDKVVAEAAAGWTNAPKITVVQSANELPAEVSGADPLAPGFYDSNTGTVYVVADNAVDAASVKGTVFHESLGHYGLEQEFGEKLDKILKDILSTNDAAKASAAKWLQENEGAYKGLSPEARTVRALEEVFAERAEAGPIKSPGLRVAFNKIAALVRSFLRKMGVVTAYSDNDIAQVLRQAQERVTRGTKSTAPSVKQGIKEQARKQARTYENQTPEQQESEARNRLDKDAKTKTPTDVIKSFNGSTTYEKVVNLFQNDRRALKTREDDMGASGVLRTVGDLFNNVYSQLITSSQKTAFAIEKFLNPSIERIDEGLRDYAEANNLEVKDVLARLDAYMVALHEGERRHVKFLREVPLTKDFNIKLGNRMISAEAYRTMIYDQLKMDQDLAEKQAKDLRDRLENLVKNYTDKTADAALLDENSTKYAVAGKLTPSDYKAMVNKYKSDAGLQAIIKSIKEMQEAGQQLDQDANFWSRPVSNYKKFYNFAHYVPLKGKPEYEGSQDDDYIEPNRARKGSVFGKELIKEFGGRFSDSENVVLQAQSDAVRAAMRFGRKDAMKAMKNAIDQKLIKGKKILTIRFEDRENIDPKDFQQGNEFFYYAPNGDINVYRIFEQDIADSIRRTYENTNEVFETMASVTSAIGKMHTRYNPSFAIYNFVRDTLFNAYTMGIEGDVGEAKKYVDSIASKVMRIGLGPTSKAAKASRMLADGKIKELEALAAKDPAYKDILDFVQYGGKSAYIQSFSAKAKKDDMLRDFNRGALRRSGETFNKYVDSWSDSFEYVSRVAAFSVYRANAIAEQKAKGVNVNDPKIMEQINTAAAAKTKELTNFESVGKYGRKVGAFYMFFRPAATGAVRAIDSFKPAFEDVNKLIARLPDAIKNDPAAVAKFKQDHARKKLAAKHAMMAVMGMGAAIYLMALSGADDDEYGRNVVATDDMELWTRNIRIPMSYFGGDKDKKLQLPWGFGMGAFASAGAQIAATLVGNSKPQDAAANILTLGLDSYLPLPVARFNPIEHPTAWAITSSVPSFMRPAVEYAFNVDGLGRQIYRDRQNRYGDAYTGSDNVPEIYREAAIMLSDATNGEVDWSPGEINFFANSYLDGISRILHGTRGVTLAMAGEKEIDAKKDLLFVDGFLGTKSSVDAKKFQEVKEKMEKMDSMLKKFKSVAESTGDTTQLQRYLEREPMSPYLAQLYNKSVNGQLRKVREQLNAVEGGKVRGPNGEKLTVQERKDTVKQLKFYRDFLMKSITEQVEAYSGHEF
jgi:GH24 family phage-related lysozyme (muramidase)